MKYLRSLNESYQIRDVEDFVRDHLAYLLDEGYDVIVGDSDENGGNTANKLEIYIYKKEDTSASKTTNFPTDVRNRVEAHPFLWNTVSDRFIPFLHFLKKEYVIKSLYLLDIQNNVWNEKELTSINTLQQIVPIDGIRIQIYNEILCDLLSRVYKKDNTYLSELDSDEERSVWKVTKNPGRWRHYYIFYKNKFVTDRNSPVKVLKLSYDTQSSAHYNYIIHDNLCRKVEHGKLDILLRQNGLNFGDFNDAWYYIENDYNNR
jgi:hypothetical protein